MSLCPASASRKYACRISSTLTMGMSQIAAPVALNSAQGPLNWPWTPEHPSAARRSSVNIKYNLYSPCNTLSFSANLGLGGHVAGCGSMEDPVHFTLKDRTISLTPKMMA